MKQPIQPLLRCAAVLAGILSISSPLQAAEPGQATVSHLKEEGKIRVMLDGRLLTEYRYDDQPKPILYPVIGPTGAGMTRRYPIEQAPDESKDHPHHRSLWFAHGDVNGVDFWSELPGAGRIVHDRLLEASAENGRAKIKTTNKWLNANGEMIARDTRTLVFSCDGDDAVIIDYHVQIHADQSDLTFGDTKEGVMAIRTHPNLRLTKNAKQGAATTVGRSQNSEGDRDKALWGKRAKWVDYWGEIDGQTVGVAIFDHPSNPRHPTWWHARDYGLVAANPFGVHDFEKKTPSRGNLRGDLTIKQGQSISFCYRFVFHRGDVEQARIAARYEHFAAASPTS